MLVYMISLCCLTSSFSISRFSNLSSSLSMLWISQAIVGGPWSGGTSYANLTYHTNCVYVQYRNKQGSFQGWCARISTLQEQRFQILHMAVACCIVRNITSWLRRLGSAISCLYFSDLVKRSTDCSSHSLQRSCRDGKQWPDVPLRPQAHVQDEDAARRKVVSSWLRGVMGKGPEKLSEKGHCLLICFSNVSKLVCTHIAVFWPQSGASATSLLSGLHSGESSQVKSDRW